VDAFRLELSEASAHAPQLPDSEVHWDSAQCGACRHLYIQGPSQRGSSSAFRALEKITTAQVGKAVSWLCNWGREYVPSGKPTETMLALKYPASLAAVPWQKERVPGQRFLYTHCISEQHGPTYGFSCAAVNFPFMYDQPQLSAGMQRQGVRCGSEGGRRRDFAYTSGERLGADVAAERPIVGTHSL
jgi:hypothetical protein